MPANTDQSQEAQWFLKNEQELLKAAQKEREERLKQKEAEETDKALEEKRAAHWMKCPKCGHDMKVITIENVELDECTFCEGIFFDRGELDELLTRKTSSRYKFYRSIFGLGD